MSDELGDNYDGEDYDSGYEFEYDFGSNSRYLGLQVDKSSNYAIVLSDCPPVVCS